MGIRATWVILNHFFPIRYFLGTRRGLFGVRGGGRWKNHAGQWSKSVSGRRVLPSGRGRRLRGPSVDQNIWKQVRVRLATLWQGRNLGRGEGLPARSAAGVRLDQEKNFPLRRALRRT